MAHWKNPGLTRDNAWINCSFEEQILMTYQNHSMQALLLTFTLNDLGGTRTNPDVVELRQMSSFLWLSSCQKLTSGATCKGSKSLQTSCCFLGKNGERCLQTGVFRQEVAKVPPWPNVECCPPILASDGLSDYPLSREKDAMNAMFLAQVKSGSEQFPRESGGRNSSAPSPSRLPRWACSSTC